jgi:uncharacterized small protein (DUF1192 family)
MLEDEELPQKRRTWLEKPLMDPLSVADLRLYIDELRGEVARAEAAIQKKEGARGHADSFFKF